jgi:hypothetical protein
MEMWRLPDFDGLSGRKFLIQIHAQAGSIQHSKSGALAPWLQGEQVGVLRPMLDEGRADLEPREVGYRCRQLDGGGSADAAQWIVRHEVDIVCLRPAGRLHGLRQLANISHVDAGKVGDATLNVGQELPLGELFTDGKGHVGHPA